MMTKELTIWLNTHPARYAYHAGLLETYQMLFTCEGCPSELYAKDSRRKLIWIIQVINGIRQINE